MNRGIFWLFSALAGLAVLMYLRTRSPGQALIEQSAVPAPQSVVTIRDLQAADTQDKSPSRFPAAVETTTRSNETAGLPQEGLLRIRVVRSDTGEPVSGIQLMLARSPLDSAEVTVLSQGHPHQSLRTDKAGCAEYFVPIDIAYELRVLPSDALLTDMQVVDVPALDEGEKRGIEVALSMGKRSSLYGRVIDEESRSPLADAAIQVIGSPLIQTTTDFDGRFELAADRPVTVRVELQGYGKSNHSIAKCMDLAVPCIIPLLREATLEVHLHDVHGIPGVGAQVQARIENGDWGHDETVQSGTIEESGSCRLQGLPPKTAIIIEFIDRTKRQFTPFVRRHNDVLFLEPGEHRILASTVPEGHAVEGVALDHQGSAERGQEIWLLPEELLNRAPMSVRQEFKRGRISRTRTDDVGHFSFHDVPSGVWWIGPGWTNATKPNRAVAQERVRIHLVSGQPAPLVTLTIWRGLYISGYVVAANGDRYTPKHGLECLVSAVSDRFRGSGYVSTDGTYAVGPLLPGEYELTTSPGAEFTGSESIFASAGATGVILRLCKAEQVVGRVVDNMGRGLAGASVLATSASGKRQVSAIANGDGLFRIGLTPDTYDFAAWALPGGHALKRNVRVDTGGGSAQLVLGLGNAALLDVRVRGTIAGVVECRVMCDGACVAWTEFRNAKAARLVVPPGRLELLFVRASPGEPLVPTPHVMEIAQGEERELIFDL